MNIESILGVPEIVYRKKKGRGNLNPLKTLSSDPCLSKIGGCPVWHDLLVAPKNNSVLCKNCRSSEHVVLVAQVYAPIEELDRSLYIFACNRRHCSSSSKGWTVIRNQKRQTNFDRSIVSNEQTFSPEKSFPDSIISTNQWSFTNASKDSPSDVDVLMKMVAERDRQIPFKLPTPPPKQKSAKKKATSSSASKQPRTSISSTTSPQPAPISLLAPDTTNNKNTISATNSLPELLLTEVSDPFLENSSLMVKKETMCQRDDNELDDEEEDEEEDDAFVSTGVDDHHIQELLSNYLKDEDDLEAIEAIRNCHLQSADPTSSSSSVIIDKAQKSKKSRGKEKDELSDDQENRLLASITRSALKQRKETTAKPPSSSLNGQKKKSKSKEEEEDDQNSGSDAEKTMIAVEDKAILRRKRLAEQHFRKRIALEPNQVLRYAYGAEPIWMSYPDPLTKHPQEEEIPPCPICRSPRVYECQLMPGLLSFIAESRKTDSKTSESRESIAKEEESFDVQKELERRLGDGLDFGVAAIWSCPNSCSPPPTTTSDVSILERMTEVVIVQEASDFVLL